MRAVRLPRVDRHRTGQGRVIYRVRSGAADCVIHHQWRAGRPVTPHDKRGRIRAAAIHIPPIRQVKTSRLLVRIQPPEPRAFRSNRVARDDIDHRQLLRFIVIAQ